VKGRFVDVGPNFSKITQLGLYIISINCTNFQINSLCTTFYKEKESLPLIKDDANQLYEMTRWVVILVISDCQVR
jgi:hypothetical protein